MASKSSLFSKFISFFLVLIIISGVGFLGFNLMANKNMSMNMDMTSQSNESSSTSEESASNKNQMDMNMSSDSSSKEEMNMSDSGTTEQAIPQYVTSQVNTVLQNKEELNKNLTILNNILELMALDPYGVDSKSQSQDNTNTTDGQADNNTNDTNTATANTQGNTMQDMGTTYDPNKMQQLHNGLYKISLGMQLLNQLNDNLELQMEQASVNYQNTSQYYQNQYYMTVQNKNKLLEALTYVNEASTLLNINPYISKDGAVYDKDRMQQIHQSVYKFAEAVGGLNKLNDNFTKQTMSLGNLSQNSQDSMNMPEMNQSSNSIFGTMNIATIANILLIGFIVIFIVSIVGYIGRLLKPNKEAK